MRGHLSGYFKCNTHKLSMISFRMQKSGFADKAMAGLPLGVLPAPNAGAVIVCNLLPRMSIVANARPSFVLMC